MQAQTVAELLSKAWHLYGEWQAHRQHREVLDQLAELRGELDAMKLSASVEESAAIESLDRTIGTSLEDAPTEDKATYRMRLLDAKAARLRTVLVADAMNTQLRRLYLGARTERLCALDKEDGRIAANSLVLAAAVGLGVFVGVIGLVVTAEREPYYMLGMIPAGTQIKSLNWFWGIAFAVAGWGVAYMIKPLIASYSSSIWNEFGPVPAKLLNKSRERIRKKLFRG